MLSIFVHQEWLKPMSTYDESCSHRRAELGFLQFGRTVKGKVRRLIPESVMAAA